jgi:penicillin amidase
MRVDGLRAQVVVRRDRWGVPHISAANQDDLFFAQGFVQAQDRLFQMDLWRRAAQGRLAEVLGLNFVSRDAVTRRIQYRGDLAAEWEAYGPDVRSIAAAFTRGINAWVQRVRENPTEDFVAAGWSPDFWQPEDLLSRTDAFVSSGNAVEEVFRARLVAAIGRERADRLLPPPSGPTIVPSGVELSSITGVIGEAVRRVGAPPFFSALAGPLARADGPSRGGSNAWAVAPSRTTAGALLAADPHRGLEVPALRYVVHLTAPGWNVIGATAPWLPGVAIGHNDDIAWAMTAASVDTQDVYVERVNPANPRQVADGSVWTDIRAVRDTVVTKGGGKPFEYEQQYTPRGVLIAVDGERHLAYSLRWSGSEPGGASELASLGVDRARSWAEFRDALRRWRFPSATFVYADGDGHIGHQQVGLVPIRRRAAGVPAPAWNGEHDWRGWMTLDDLPHGLDAPSGRVVSANDSVARSARIGAALDAAPVHDVEGFERLQHDVVAWNATQIVPLLARIRADRADVEAARQRLLRWDRRIVSGSADASLYVAWEDAMMRMLARRQVPGGLVDEVVEEARAAIIHALVEPAPSWFDGNVVRARDSLLADALAAAVDAAGQRSVAPVTFVHPLGIDARTRQRFNVGPFAVPGYAETILSIRTTPSGRAIGPSFRAIFSPSAWDASVAVNAPGQSGLPSSPHYRDLAQLWAGGDYFPLAFSRQAVQAGTESVLTLTPAAPR